MKRKIEPHTLWEHTPKAVKAGAPEDRVFAVVCLDGRRGVAWKCTRLANGKLSHPAYRKPLASDDPRLFVAQGRNGSKPTACFPVDSFHVLCSVQARDAR